MFMPQQPYLPLGDLRAVVAYPASPRRFRAAEVKKALRKCGLDHLSSRLVAKERWDQVLSGGEDKQLRVWNIKTREKVSSLGKHAAPVTAVAWPGDGKVVLAVTSIRLRS